MLKLEINLLSLLFFLSSSSFKVKIKKIGSKTDSIHFPFFYVNYFEMAESKFAQACASLNGPGRKQAEAYLTDLTSKDNAAVCLPVCRAILQTDCSDNITFHALAAVKLIVVRDYNIQVASEWLYFLLNTLRAMDLNVLPQFVKGQFLQSIALIAKRAWLDTEPDQNLLIKHIYGEFNAPAKVALISAFVSGMRTPFLIIKRCLLLKLAHAAFRMIFTRHVVCLLKVCISLLYTLKSGLCMNNLFVAVLKLLSCAQDEESDPHFDLLCLEVLDQILSWDFSHSDDSLAGSFSKNEDDEVSLSNSFPESWREILLDSNLAGLFCLVQYKSAEPSVSHLSMQCLITLSGVCGPALSEGVTREEEHAMVSKYLNGFLIEVLQMLDG
jgi:hypothetical protein